MRALCLRIIRVIVLICISSVCSYPSRSSKLVSFRAIPTASEMSFEQSGNFFEGDIITEIIQARNGLTTDWYRWPNAIVYYEFDKVFDDEKRGAIRYAFDDIESVTCVKFKLKTNSSKDFVYISADNIGCNSHVGRIGGKQKMNLQLVGCIYHGTIIHEALHSLGFKHEHSAPDRDKFIRILSENIPADYLYAFEKLSARYTTDFGVPYDYESVMHYDSKAFSKNGKDTIETLQKGVKIGQRIGLSINDIRKVNLMYKCPGSKYLL